MQVRIGSASMAQTCNSTNNERIMDKSVTRSEDADMLLQGIA